MSKRQKIIFHIFRLFIFIILIGNLIQINLPFGKDLTLDKMLTKIDKSPSISSTSLNYDLVWERIWPMDTETQGGRKIAIDSDDNIYQTGYWILENINRAKVLLTKWNTESEKVWSITWGYDQSEYGRDVVVDKEDNVYVCGSTQNSGTGYSDMFLVKFDSSGNELWNSSWGKTDYAAGEAIAID